MATSIGSSGNLIVGKQTVTTAGTQVQLSTTQYLVTSVAIWGFEGNAGKWYLGGDDVASTTHDGFAPGKGIELSGKPGGGLDLSKIWVDTANNGDSVDFVAVV